MEKITETCVFVISTAPQKRLGGNLAVAEAFGADFEAEMRVNQVSQNRVNWLNTADRTTYMCELFKFESVFSQF